MSNKHTSNFFLKGNFRQLLEIYKIFFVHNQGQTNLKKLQSNAFIKNAFKNLSDIWNYETPFI